MIKRLLFVFLCILLFLAGLLPLAVLYGISYLAYLVLYYVIHYRKKVVVQNLARSFPGEGEAEREVVARDFYRSFTNHFAEMIKLVTISTRALQKRVVFEGGEEIGRWVGQGRNVIAYMGHCGNWEMLNVLPSLVSFDMYAVYKPLRSKLFDRMMRRIRSRFGMRLISSKSVARHLLSKKAGPAMYLFIADQCPGKVDEKYRMEFLHQPTAMFSGAEKLSKAGDAVVVYLHMSQLSRGRYKVTSIPFCLHAAETADTEITREFARLLEENIREAPAEWLWSHKRWKR